jgi:hypothetical protein
MDGVLYLHNPFFGGPASPAILSQCPKYVSYHCAITYHRSQFCFIFFFSLHGHGLSNFSVFSPVMRFGLLSGLFGMAEIPTGGIAMHVAKKAKRKGVACMGGRNVRI